MDLRILSSSKVHRVSKRAREHMHMDSDKRMSPLCGVFIRDQAVKVIK